MAAQKRSKKSRRAKRPIARVHARELWRGTARLMKTRGASLTLLALPFGTFIVTAALTLAMGHSLQSLFDDPKPLSPLETTIAGLVETLQIALSATICCVAYAKLTAAEELDADATKASRA